MNQSICAVFLCLATLALAQPSGPIERSDPTIVEIGPHHRLWERLDTYANAQGQLYHSPARYIELGTFINYWDGEWKPSQERFEIVQGSAVAAQGACQARVAANLNSLGAIEFWDPSGQIFQSHILGLAFHDTASGQTLLFAEPKDCLGAMDPARPNVLYYQDAFDSILADVRITYKKSGMSQDVILLTAPQLPQGMDPLTTRLEVWTEFAQAHEPVAHPKILRPDTPQLPGLTDHLLDFGSFMVADGFAFNLGSEDAFDYSAVPTVVLATSS